MPTALPAATAFTGASVTEGAFKTAITDQRAFLADLLGTDGVPATAREALGVGATDSVTIASLTTTGNVTASGGTITVGGAAFPGATCAGTIFNSDNSNPASNAALNAKVGGANAGDARATFDINGVLVWIVGVDNSDSDQFKIAQGALGSNDVLAITNGGHVNIGATGVPVRLHVKSDQPSAGGPIAELYSANAQNQAITFFVADASGASSANCVQQIQKVTGTGRSINAAGTVNASGADYAEYERKAPNCGVIAKGQIVGFDASGRITDRWPEAISFGVKSSDPSYVGGDRWGGDDALSVVDGQPLGSMPRPPRQTADPEYDGPPHPGEQPVPPKVVEVAMPEAPVLQKSEADETFAVRTAAWLQARNAAIAKAAIASGEFDAAQTAYVAALSDWRMKEAAWSAAQPAFLERVKAHEKAHAAARDQYESDRKAFEARVEANRQTVDRIAYSGKTPVNISAAQPGDYVVPMALPDGGIGCKAVASAAIAFDEYRIAVGQVRRVLTDGRAEIAIKVG